MMLFFYERKLSINRNLEVLYKRRKASYSSLNLPNGELCSNPSTIHSAAIKFSRQHLSCEPVAYSLLCWRLFLMSFLI